MTRNDMAFLFGGALLFFGADKYSYLLMALGGALLLLAYYLAPKK